jgi:hypothetical protein
MGWRTRMSGREAKSLFLFSYPLKLIAYSFEWMEGNTWEYEIKYFLLLERRIRRG